MVNYAPDEDAYPERAQRVEGPLLNPTKDSCPEEHRDELTLRVRILFGRPKVPTRLDKDGLLYPLEARSWALNATRKHPSAWDLSSTGHGTPATDHSASIPQSGGFAQ